MVIFHSYVGFPEGTRFQTEIDTVDGYEILHQAGELWKVPMKHCK